MLRHCGRNLYLPSRIVLALFLLCGLLLYTTSCEQKEKVAEPREKITIAYSTASNAMLMYIAFAKGYFTEEGLDAVPQAHAFGKPALNAVIEGKADLATVGDTPFVFAVLKGAKITALATIQTSNRNEAIVARRDRGIAKPADLRGKNIGVTAGTTGDFFADSFLLVNGVERKQARFIDLKPAEMSAALDAGQVDAISTWNPTLKQLEKKLGSNGITFFGESLYTETFCIAAGQAYVRKNPGAIRKVLRALIKAETFASRNDKEARRLAADFIKTDKTVLDATWNIFTLRVTLDQSLLVNFEDQTRWALKNGLTSAKDMPNYLDYIHAGALYSIKPSAVRIIR